MALHRWIDPRRSLNGYLNLRTASVKDALRRVLESANKVLTTDVIADIIERGQVDTRITAEVQRAIDDALEQHWRPAIEAAAESGLKALSRSGPLPPTTDLAKRDDPPSGPPLGVVRYIEQRETWLREYLGRGLGRNVSNLMRSAAEDEQWGSGTTARDLRRVLPLGERDADRLMRMYQTDREEHGAREARRRLEERREKLLDRRAKNFAQSEITNMWNRGTLEDVKERVRDGKIDPNTTKVWLTVGDDRVCPICGPLHEKELPLDEDFESEGFVGQSPGAHNGCRCALAYKRRPTEEELEKDLVLLMPVLESGSDRKVTNWEFTGKLVRYLIRTKLRPGREAWEWINRRTSTLSLAARAYILSRPVMRRMSGDYHIPDGPLYMGTGPDPDAADLPSGTLPTDALGQEAEGAFGPPDVHWIGNDPVTRQRREEALANTERIRQAFALFGGRGDRVKDIPFTETFVKRRQDKLWRLDTDKGFEEDLRGWIAVATSGKYFADESDFVAPGDVAKVDLGTILHNKPNQADMLDAIDYLDLDPNRSVALYPVQGTGNESVRKYGNVLVEAAEYFGGIEARASAFRIQQATGSELTYRPPGIEHVVEALDVKQDAYIAWYIAARNPETKYDLDVATAAKWLSVLRGATDSVEADAIIRTLPDGFMDGLQKAEATWKVLGRYFEVDSVENLSYARFSVFIDKKGSGFGPVYDPDGNAPKPLVPPALFRWNPVSGEWDAEQFADTMMEWHHYMKNGMLPPQWAIPTYDDMGELEGILDVDLLEWKLEHGAAWPTWVSNSSRMNDLIRYLDLDGPVGERKANQLKRVAFTSGQGHVYIPEGTRGAIQPYTIDTDEVLRWLLTEDKILQGLEEQYLDLKVSSDEFWDRLQQMVLSDTLSGGAETPDEKTVGAFLDAVANIPSGDEFEDYLNVVRSRVGQSLRFWHHVEHLFDPDDRHNLAYMPYSIVARKPAHKPGITPPQLELPSMFKRVVDPDTGELKIMGVLHNASSGPVLSPNHTWQYAQNFEKALNRPISNEAQAAVYYIVKMRDFEDMVYQQYQIPPSLLRSAQFRGLRELGDPDFSAAGDHLYYYLTQNPDLGYSEQRAFERVKLFDEGLRLYEERYNQLKEITRASEDARQVLMMMGMREYHNAWAQSSWYSELTSTLQTNVMRFPGDFGAEGHKLNGPGWIWPALDAVNDHTITTRSYLADLLSADDPIGVLVAEAEDWARLMPAGSDTPNFFSKGSILGSIDQMAEMSPVLRRAAREQHLADMEWLTDALGLTPDSPVMLFRGMSHTGAANRGFANDIYGDVKKIPGGRVIGKPDQSPLSSWTFNWKTAENFGDYLLVTTAKLKDIQSIGGPLPGLGTAYEFEAVMRPTANGVVGVDPKRLLQLFKPEPIGGWYVRGRGKLSVQQAGFNSPFTLETYQDAIDELEYNLGEWAQGVPDFKIDMPFDLADPELWSHKAEIGQELIGSDLWQARLLPIFERAFGDRPDITIEEVSVMHPVIDDKSAQAMLRIDVMVGNMGEDGAHDIKLRMFMPVQQPGAGFTPNWEVPGIDMDTLVPEWIELVPDNEPADFLYGTKAEAFFQDPTDVLPKNQVDRLRKLEEEAARIFGEVPVILDELRMDAKLWALEVDPNQSTNRELERAVSTELQGLLSKGTLEPEVLTGLPPFRVQFDFLPDVYQDPNTGKWVWPYELRLETERSVMDMAFTAVEGEDVGRPGRAGRIKGISWHGTGYVLTDEAPYEVKQITGNNMERFLIHDVDINMDVEWSQRFATSTPLPTNLDYRGTAPGQPIKNLPYVEARPPDVDVDITLPGGDVGHKHVNGAKLLSTLIEEAGLFDKLRTGDSIPAKDGIDVFWISKKGPQTGRWWGWFSGADQGIFIDGSRFKDVIDDIVAAWEANDMVSLYFRKTTNYKGEVIWVPRALERRKEITNAMITMAHEGLHANYHRVDAPYRYPTHALLEEYAVEVMARGRAALLIPRAPDSGIIGQDISTGGLVTRNLEVRTVERFLRWLDAGEMQQYGHNVGQRGFRFAQELYNAKDMRELVVSRAYQRLLADMDQWLGRTDMGLFSPAMRTTADNARRAFERGLASPDPTKAINIFRVLQRNEQTLARDMAAIRKALEADPNDLGAVRQAVQYFRQWQAKMGLAVDEYASPFSKDADWKWELKLARPPRETGERIAAMAEFLEDWDGISVLAELGDWQGMIDWIELVGVESVLNLVDMEPRHGIYAHTRIRDWWAGVMSGSVRPDAVPPPKYLDEFLPAVSKKYYEITGEVVPVSRNMGWAISRSVTELMQTLGGVKLHVNAVATDDIYTTIVRLRQTNNDPNLPLNDMIKVVTRDLAVRALEEGRMDAEDALRVVDGFDAWNWKPNPNEFVTMMNDYFGTVE